MTVPTAPSAGTKAGEIVCGTTAYAGVTYAIPYFAQRLAAALIPGLQRELARQGINL